MIVEHSFVTTLEPDAAFALAEELLSPLRFKSEAQETGDSSQESGVRGQDPGLRSQIRRGETHDPGLSTHDALNGSSLIAVAAATSSLLSSRSWKRGAQNPRRARGHSNLSTRVRMDYDRGRVVVAASVEGPGNDPPRIPRLLAVGITLALERSLALGHPLAEARADCDRYHAKMSNRDLAYRIFGWGSLAIAVGLIIALIGASVAR